MNRKNDVFALRGGRRLLALLGGLMLAGVLLVACGSASAGNGGDTPEPAGDRVEAPIREVETILGNGTYTIRIVAAIEDDCNQPAGHAAVFDTATASGRIQVYNTRLHTLLPCNAADRTYELLVEVPAEQNIGVTYRVEVNGVVFEQGQ